MNEIFDVKNLGQVFTPPNVVDTMLSMIKNKGRILEPSCGDGAFSNKIPNCVAIEYDKSKCPLYALNMDFFDYPIEEKFDTIIGNPPYVKYKNIANDTKLKLDMELFDERGNLYMFFIYKCIKHLKDKGELIFIVPREFFKATASIKLNEFIYENGTITDIINLGDKNIFEKHNPNCIIFRFEKGNFSRKTNEVKDFKVVNGQISFTENDYVVPFSDLFYVKVGAVSGADNIFEHENGNADFVCSYTQKTGKTKRMFYNINSKELELHKETLLSRKIKKFDDSNWFTWGRNHYISDKERLYVNYRLRGTNPFFYHTCKNYDGSTLAIFPKFECSVDELKEIRDMLNNVDWEEIGFYYNERYLFTQKSLENCLLPKEFSKYLKL